LFVHTLGDLDFLQAAGREAAHYADRIPGAAFYESKLAAMWERARDTRAYRHLGPFDRDSFGRLPATGRSSLRRQPARFQRVGLDAAAVYYETSAEISGGPHPALPLPRTVEEILWEVATLARAWAHLLGREDRVAIAVPSDVVPEADLVVRVCEAVGVVYARAYPLADGACDWDRMLDVWRSLEPTVVVVTSDVAAELAAQVEAGGRAAALIGQVRRVMLLGGAQPTPLRDRLAGAWPAEVHETGDLAEIGPIATSCEHAVMHLLTSAYFVELDRGRGALPLEQADRGRLLVTPLNWYSRALLRYGTGREVFLGHSCRCGRLTPTVRMRSSDDSRGG